MKYLLSIITILLSLSSCNLDVIPENKITYANAFSSESELNTTTSSILYYMGRVSSRIYPMSIAGLKMDETESDQALREWNPKVVASNSDWKNLYDIIYLGNLLLDNIDQTQGLSADRYNYHAGQAHFALGFAYLTLSQVWGEAVIPDNSKVIREYTLSPILSVVNKGIEHALKAYQLLPTYENLRGLGGISITSKQIGNKGNTAALLAHLYAWKGSMIDLYHLEGESSAEAYRQSVFYASELIEGRAGNYRLCSTPEELCQKLSEIQSNNPEEIFSFTFDVGRSNETTSPNWIATDYLSWPVNRTKTQADLATTRFRLLKSTVEEMYPESSDLRREAFFYEWNNPHEIDGVDYAIPYKFRSALFDQDQYSASGESFRSIRADYVYWRLADLYLLRAECNNKLGNTDTAISDLNIIRQRAGASVYPYNGEHDLKLAIFREREREFLGENESRYFDIIRNEYYRTELLGKFQLLSDQEVQNGALFLPIPQDATRDRNNQVVNTRILQRRYWLPYSK